MARFTLHFRDHPLRLIPLGGRELVIGRDPACAIHIDSLALGEQHARVIFDKGNWTVAPWDEAHPVFVNGERIHHPHRLREGDVVRVGKHSLHFSEEAAPSVSVAPPPRANVTKLPLNRELEGYLQFLSGSHVGRTIRLNRAMTRLGKSGELSALIARRRDGYYLSLLEGENSPELNGKPIGDRTCRLENGDRIRIGTLELQFFLEATDSGTPLAHDHYGERRFTRIAFPVAARLLDGDTVLPCRVLDLSLKGALVELDESPRPSPGRILILEIPLDDAARIRMEVETVRQDGSRHGLLCRDIDVDSITHLRRLVTLNSGEPELLERELAELG